MLATLIRSQLRRTLLAALLGSTLVACATPSAAQQTGTPTITATNEATMPPDDTAEPTGLPTTEPASDAASGPTTGRYTCWDISNPSTPPAILWDMWIDGDGTYATESDAERWAFRYDGSTKRVEFLEGTWAERGCIGDFRAAGDIVYDRVNQKTKIVMHDPVLEANVGGNRDIITCDLSDG